MVWQSNPISFTGSILSFVNRILLRGKSRWYPPIACLTNLLWVIFGWHIQNPEMAVSNSIYFVQSIETWVTWERSMKIWMCACGNYNRDEKSDCLKCGEKMVKESGHDPEASCSQSKRSSVWAIPWFCGLEGYWSPVLYYWITPSTCLDFRSSTKLSYTLELRFFILLVKKRQVLDRLSSRVSHPIGYLHETSGI